MNIWIAATSWCKLSYGTTWISWYSSIYYITIKLISISICLFIHLFIYITYITYITFSLISLMAWNPNLTMSGLVQRRVELRRAGHGRCRAAALLRRGHGRGPTARGGAFHGSGNHMVMVKVWKRRWYIVLYIYIHIYQKDIDIDR